MSAENAKLLSQQLKEGTSAAHAAAENVLFVKNFIKGEIPLSLYTRLLVDLWHVYSTMERRLEEDALAKSRHEGGIVDPIFFPHELNRRDSLELDLEYWLGADWRTTAVAEMSPMTAEYCKRLENCNSAGLVAHSYTRYMGDLSGGQVLMRKARKAFDLPPRSVDGLRFYEFDQIPKASTFKDQYRQELDGLRPAQSVCDEIVAESNVAFLMNMRLFTELDLLSGAEGVEPLPPLSQAVEVLLERARVESAENAALVAEGKTTPRMECPFANLGRFLENSDFKWLLNLHAAEGEKDAFEQDAARVKAEAEAKQARAFRQQVDSSSGSELVDSWMRMLKIAGVLVPACGMVIVLPSMIAAAPEALAVVNATQ
jgi:heme oxygenase